MTRLELIALPIFALAGLCLTQATFAQEDSPTDSAAQTESKTEKPADSDEDKPSSKEKAKEEKKDRKTHKVAEQLLKIEETLDGVFVADQMAEVSLWPESWSDFKIKEVVPHGTKVQKGQTLVTFEGKELEKAIADLEVEQRLSELKLMRSEQGIPLQERALQRQLADAEEALRRVKEDHERYRETEREQSIESAEWNLKSAKFALDYYKEELEQLEKMYEADDLTEETEEIILKRQRFYVESGEFRYELSKHIHGVTLNVMIPRRDRDFSETLKTSEESLERAQTASQLDLNIARYELEKAKLERKKSLEKHVMLLADRDLLTVDSPMAGVVYYGECVQGKWSKIADMRDKLQPNKSVAKGTTMMTVVDAAKQYVSASLDEKLRTSIKEGQSVEVQPAVEHVDPLEATVASISLAPIAEGKFESRINLSGSLPDWITPGMSAKVKLVTYEKKDALTAPKKAVHTDDETDKKYVWLVDGDDVKKTWVETGRSKGEKIEITEGLSAGDVISLDDEKEKED